MNIKTQTISIDMRVRMFTALIGLSTLSLGVYFYAVIATINHTMAKESLTTELATLSVRVSELEYQGLALKNMINLDSALSQGFSEVKSPLYVSRSSVSLTLNTQGR